MDRWRQREEAQRILMEERAQRRREEMRERNRVYRREYTGGLAVEIRRDQEQDREPTHQGRVMMQQRAAHQEQELYLQQCQNQADQGWRDWG